ncbi:MULTISPECIES: acyltransferase [unclassified Pseudoalteromonas]|uniref:acyltransferase n=1 Tax=unclassified Pseudoalteromonas TaxID=194690 RepID=UPI0025B593D5|nr:MULTISPECIES: acyltransferase [unclassified Pseudoalteromonas]MDN3408132.1 acyltransferase [Pseudoalteromonas sp. APC 3894]MDN3415772.1 acyltransferase [Pseudoalteromonas sp. APC 3227]MDN3419470.1 acyltransferase [Pseudoalteromonas sp. APC 3895]MDN3422839.1 acyltransferase [Pseudoalteromonas sp. APC 3896]
MNKLKKKLLSYAKGIPLNIFITNFIFQKILRIDSDCKFSKCFTSRVISPQKIIIDGLKENSSVLKSFAVSGGCYIQASEGLVIGEGTIWSFNVAIVSQGHNLKDFYKIPHNDPIEIGKNCWIGANSTILPGVKLGNNTIVGANSVVTSSFPEGGVIIGGVPAKLIRSI